jgi:hypothetical protein
MKHIPTYLNTYLSTYLSRYPSHSYVDYGTDSTWWQISQVPLQRARGGKTYFVQQLFRNTEKLKFSMLKSTLAQ